MIQVRSVVGACHRRLAEAMVSKNIITVNQPDEGDHLRHMGWGGKRGHPFQLSTRDCCLVSLHHVQQPVQGPLVRQQLYCVYHQGVTLLYLLCFHSCATLFQGISACMLVDENVQTDLSRLVEFWSLNCQLTGCSTECFSFLNHF